MRRWPAMILAGATLGAAACLGTLQRDAASETVTLAGRRPIDLPIRERRPYWLLRSEPGWDAAFEVRYGGDPEDPAVAVVRAVRFDDGDTAAHAFSRLTPDYLYIALRDRMTGTPWPLDYPVPLPGDEVSTTAYGVRLPGVPPQEPTIYGQLTAVRAGRFVLLIESIGVHPEHLVPTIIALTSAALEYSE